MFKIEIWKTLKFKGEKSIYKISSEGRIKNKINKKILRTQIDKNGYERVRLIHNGHKYSKSVHRLVAKTFIENPYNFKEVNHKDGIKLHNFVENLEWTTRSDNMKHAYKTGLHIIKVGEDHHNSKYTEAQIIKACELIEKGYSNKYVSKNTGINYTIISKIRNGEAWKHISSQFCNIKPLKHKTN